MHHETCEPGFIPIRLAWVLTLNPMMGKTEDREAVAWAPSKEALQAYIDRERVETYVDDGESAFSGEPSQFTKHFRKGGPLEWFNPPEDLSTKQEEVFREVALVEEEDARKIAIAPVRDDIPFVG